VTSLPAKDNKTLSKHRQVITRPQYSCVTLFCFHSITPHYTTLPTEECHKSFIYSPTDALVSCLTQQY